MKSNDTAVRVANVSKRYRIGLREEMHENLASAALHFLKSPLKNFRKYRSLYTFNDTEEGRADNPRQTPDDIIWALKDINFEVKKGEAVGIIGRNGAGKSTLLKILSRITFPTTGQVEIKGRFSSLLEVGTGFHPELTGRDNVFLNGTILGMTKKEIKSRFDEIIDFSGIEKFIDTPVKRYSSGMRVRLAFSVAAHLNPEILMVDEVLAVGDAAFQRKCLGKMDDVVKQGRTVLFVSHNTAHIKAFCQRAIILKEGEMILDANATEAVAYYTGFFMERSTIRLSDRTDRRGNGILRFTDFWIEKNGAVCHDKVTTGEDLKFCFEYTAEHELKNVDVSFSIQQYIGDPIVNCNVADSMGNFASIPPKGVIVCEIKKFPVQPSRYTANIFSTVAGHVADTMNGAFTIDVEGGDYYGTGRIPQKGKVLVNQTWSVQSR